MVQARYYNAFTYSLLFDSEVREANEVLPFF